MPINRQQPPIMLPGPPGYNPPQPPPFMAFPNQPPGIRPQPPEIPQPRPPVQMPGPTPQPTPQPPGGGGVSPPPGGWQIELAGGGFGQTGGQIGPPEQYPQPIPMRERDPWAPNSGPIARLKDWEIQEEYPGINQPAPFPRNRGGIGRAQTWADRGMLPGMGRGQPTGGRGTRGGRPPFPPWGGGQPMGGGMNLQPQPTPFFPPTMSPPMSGGAGGSPMFPPGTNPWDIPGARSGSGFLFPPGTDLGQNAPQFTPTDVIRENQDAQRRLRMGMGTRRGGTPSDIILENQKEQERRRSLLA